MALRSTTRNHDKPAFKAGRSSTAFIVHRDAQTGRFAPNGKVKEHHAGSAITQTSKKR